MRRVRAYIGLGANLGDPDTTLARGVRALAKLPASRLHAVSRLYATEPVGVVDQPVFRNAVAVLDVPAGPDPAAGATALLIALKQLERAFGRQERERWGPRELDLDLLVFGRARLDVDRPPDGLSLDPGKTDRLLVVPHPEAANRLFVLAPLADVAAGLVPPGWTETVATAAARRLIDEGPDAARPVAAWDADRARWRAGSSMPSERSRASGVTPSGRAAPVTTGRRRRAPGGRSRPAPG
ncbi:MAG TPA: 2-amino-4-hydroxy-6-hydroxymethyldihydropteridine diphosphokinase [Patescibacteria group bacterium]|nr:2-amino-4-hydroxy-6-hydroxymethyldihydropteridine diphosphokinase [Patescibacteria group bacterium]